MKRIICFFLGHKRWYQTPFSGTWIELDVCKRCGVSEELGEDINGIKPICKSFSNK